MFVVQTRLPLLDAPSNTKHSLAVRLIGDYPLIIATMSSSTPDLVPSDANVARFLNHNDLHIYINEKLFFGESTTLRLLDWCQRHLGESVCLYEHRSPSCRWLRLSLSTKTTFCRGIDSLGLAVQANVWKL
jgi:hypothetical protein